MTAPTIHDARLSEIERLRLFIGRCQARIDENLASAKAQTRPEIRQVYAEIADMWEGQKRDFEWRLAALTGESET